MPAVVKLEFENLEIGVVEISNHLYLKSPTAKEYLVTLLKERGYRLIDIRDDPKQRQYYASIADLESRPVALMYAAAPVRSCYVCESCKNINESDHNTCEKCGYQWSGSTYLGGPFKYRYQGKVYDRESSLPIMSSWEIFEAWHWAPLKTTPTLHQQLFSLFRIIHDKGYFIQDGRPVFSEYTWYRLGKVIRHFTGLDADRWDRESRWFPLDGPGGIDGVAKFCHSNPVVIDAPHIENLLNAALKVNNGQTLSEREYTAAQRGQEDTSWKT